MKHLSKHWDVCLSSFKVQKRITVYVDVYSKISISLAYARYMRDSRFVSWFHSTIKNTLTFSCIILKNKFISRHSTSANVLVWAYVQHIIMKCSSSKKWILCIHCFSLSLRWLNWNSRWTSAKSKLMICIAYAKSTHQLNDCLKNIEEIFSFELMLQFDFRY